MAQTRLTDRRTTGEVIDLAHPDEIEIRRLPASSPEEAADIRAELEARGFAVTVREVGAGREGPGSYHAEVFAEKRTVPTEAELAARRADAAAEDRARRRATRLLWIGVVIAGGLLLLILAYLLGPLAWVIRQIF